MKKNLTNIKDYDNWANKKILKHLADNKISDQNIFALISHIIDSDNNWISRIYGKGENSLTFSETNYQIIEEAIDNKNQKINNIIYEKDLGEIISYERSDGKSFKRTLSDILMHLFIHSSHHRGQIMIRLRELNIDTINVDYITYCREF